MEAPTASKIKLKDQTHKTIIKIILIAAIIIFCFVCSIIGLLIEDQQNNLVFEKFRNLMCNLI